MNYAVAIWNFHQPELSLIALIEDFLAMGYDTISFLPRELTSLNADEKRDLRAFLRERSIPVTVHGKAEMPPAEAREIWQLLGDNLRCLSFDAAMITDSRGTFFDAPRMANLLREIEQFSRGTALRFGIEDFPLDAQAANFYHNDLAPLLDNQRFGILIDIGHMNLRRTLHDAFRTQSIADYLRTASATRRIFEIHVHDNDGKKDLHQPLGHGNIPFNQVAEALRSIGFDGVATLELAPKFYGSTPAEARPHARQSLEHWRQLWTKA